MPVGRWMTTAQVHQGIEDAGHEVSRRTVERDLLNLARPFGLDLRGDRAGGYHWRRTRALDAVG